MKLTLYLIGGLAGATALTSLHQTFRYLVRATAPRLDLVGEEGVGKLIQAAGHSKPEEDDLFAITLLGDIVSNAIFYSSIGLSKTKHLLRSGIWLGLAAGIGALTLTKPLGLHDHPINKKQTTKILTVGLYLVGGIVSALTIKSLRHQNGKYLARKKI